ncbi:MAG TPA: tetratricopeptide repeat protein, partial [Sphingomicrobium sp.]|nr:tetratricopeptide repeat protein [Sphingomicrobium sp.]
AKLALTEAEKALEHDPNNGAALSVAARALAGLGDAQGAKAMIDRGLLLDPDNLNMCYNLASVYAAELHDPESALALLEPTMAKVSGALIRWVDIDPDVDSLRGDPRFISIVAEAKERIAKAQVEPAQATSATPAAS